MPAGFEHNETDASLERQDVRSLTMTWPKPARRMVSVGSQDSMRMSKSKAPIRGRTRYGRRSARIRCRRFPDPSDDDGESLNSGGAVPTGEDAHAGLEVEAIQTKRAVRPEDAEYVRQCPSADSRDDWTAALRRPKLGIESAPQGSGGSEPRPPWPAPPAGPRRCAPRRTLRSHVVLAQPRELLGREPRSGHASAHAA